MAIRNGFSGQILKIIQIAVPSRRSLVCLEVVEADHVDVDTVDLVEDTP
jgi:hypothetical protein